MDAFRAAFGSVEEEKPATIEEVVERDEEADDDWRAVELPEGITLR